jgi:flagellar hook protein FlgE
MPRTVAWQQQTAQMATTLTFDNNATLTGGKRHPYTDHPGATCTFNLSFLNSMQQNTGANNVVATTQNGYKPGDLVSYQINDDGTVVGNYSNEQTQVLGQIVLANFANNEGLKSEGDNVWSAPSPPAWRCWVQQEPVTSVR